MTTADTRPQADSTPAFCEGILHFARPSADFATLGKTASIRAGSHAVAELDDAAVFQTQLAADALRYTTLQLCASKESGHPGGFASSAEAYAALIMLGHTNIVTEVGHHAPGFYSAMFLDTSLEDMGIRTMTELQERFRERHGLLGHLSGAIPGLLAPAGPLGQGQHFAMAGALLNPDMLFPCTIGDGGMGEPYVLTAMMHFHTAYPSVTNFLPILIWNGYSQEHHSMVSLMTNEEMIAYWRGHGFGRVILVDAKDFDDADQDGAYVDSTRFCSPARLAFSRAVLEGAEEAADAALAGTLTVFILKQLKGAGVHTIGAKSHNLYPGDTLRKRQHRRGPATARPAPGGLGPGAHQSLPRRWRPRWPHGGDGTGTVPARPRTLPRQEFAPGDKAVPATALGALVASVGQRDPRFVVTNADGNEASAMKNINDA